MKVNHVLPVLLLFVAFALCPSPSVYAKSSEEASKSSVDEVIESIRSGTYEDGILISDLETANNYLSPAFFDKYNVYNNDFVNDFDAIKSVDGYDYRGVVSDSTLEVSFFEYFSNGTFGRQFRFMTSFFNDSVDYREVKSFYYNPDTDSIHFYSTFDFYIINASNSFTVYQFLSNSSSRYNYYYVLPDGTNSYDLPVNKPSTGESDLSVVNPSDKDSDNKPSDGETDIFSIMNLLLVFSVSILSIITSNSVMAFILASSLVVVCILVLRQIKSSL